MLDETDILERLVAVEQREKSNAHRIDDLERSQVAINDLATSTKLIAQKLDSMSTNVDRLASKVESIESEPGNKWRVVTEKIIILVIGGVVAFFLAKIGM